MGGIQIQIYLVTWKVGWIFYILGRKEPAGGLRVNPQLAWAQAMDSLFLFLLRKSLRTGMCMSIVSNDSQRFHGPPLVEYLASVNGPKGRKASDIGHFCTLVASPSNLDRATKDEMFLGGGGMPWTQAKGEPET